MKILKILILPWLFLSAAIAGHCLVEAVGAGHPLTVSSYWDHRFLKPFLNQCRIKGCAWKSQRQAAGEWIMVSTIE